MEAKDILSFMHEAEKVKCVLRHSFLSSGRQESSAEHTFRVALLAMLVGEKLDRKIDVCKAVKIALIHDICEAYAGDVPAFMKEEHKKQKKIEERHMLEMKRRFDDDQTDKIFSLWEEYERLKTDEAKLVKAMDKLEVHIQHNEADMSTWIDIEFPRSQYAGEEFFGFDSFIFELWEIVKEESRKKIKEESSRDLKEIDLQADRLRKET